MPDVVIYTTEYCPYCVKAKALLARKGVSYKEIRVDLDDDLRAEMVEKSGRQSVPQIFINHQHIGGCDDLHALEAQGLLDNLLNKDNKND